METLYDILEVSRKASKEVIEKAYRTLAKKYHPDLQTPENKAYAEEMMKKINEAYDILSDDEKRSAYDRKLEEAEIQKQEQQQNKYNNYNSEYTNNITYTNQTPNNMYNQTRSANTNDNINTNNEDDWRSQFAKLSKKEQQKIIKNIQKEANEEYRRQYENYFRSLGFKIKHRWTFKDFLTIGLIIVALIVIFLILWLIPPTHNWMLQLYENNFVVNILVSIIIGIGQGIVKFLKNIASF